jgi:transketolase
MNLYSKIARLKVIDVSARVGAVHFGGIFSIIDFFIAFYGHFSASNLTASVLTPKKLMDQNFPELFMSKGHCYLAQLAALDTLFENSNFCEKYLCDGSDFFGHPKRKNQSKLFPVSSGSLGQGITMANGAALANKLLGNNNTVWTVIGDGELNEGAVNEAIQFSAQKRLRHVVVIDNNKQESLDFTAAILSNGHVEDRFKAYDVNFISCNGHHLPKLLEVFEKLKTSDGTTILNLETIKGSGVKFMERDPKWHSRRMSKEEFDLSRTKFR